MVYIVISAILLYLARTLFMFVGSSIIKRKNKIKTNNHTPKVSIVVPARNEEQNIEKCLLSIAKSDYPIELYEIIAINDRSDDSTLSILENLANKISNLKIINLTEQRHESNLRGKPGAIHQGILQAGGDIILMTDADCIVHYHWIRAIAANYQDPNLGLQAAFTLISGTRVFDLIQSVEWIYMHTMASAGVGLNNPLGCYGNNLSITKNDYHQLGGYPNIEFSITEDMALQKAVFKSKRNINYLIDINSTVTTLPEKTFSDYISQHRRWAIGGLALGWKAALFVLTSLLLWIAIALSIATGNILWLTALLFTRFAGDYAVIYPSLNILEQYHLRSYVPISIAFFMFIELILPLTLISRKVVWKGQVFKK